MRRALIMIFICIPWLSGCAEQPRPIPLGTDRAYYGYIDQGEKFGVRIGQSRDEAQDILVAGGARDDGEWNCNYNLKELFSCKEGDVFDLYSYRKFMKDGTVYLKISEGKISEIGWRFQLFHIDF